MGYFTDALTHDKLWILYFLRAVDMRLTNEQLVRVSMDNGWTNYFDLQEALIDLVDNALIALVHKPNDNYYALTPAGVDALGQFETRIPFSTREALSQYADDNRETLRKQTQVLSDLRAQGDGQYQVTLKLLENSNQLAKVSLLVDSRESAWRVRDAWDSRSDELYGALLKLFVE